MKEIVAAFGLLEEDGRVFLVRERRNLDGVETDCWDLPGGGVEDGEALVETVVREFNEETGFVVEPTGLAFVVERFGFRSPDPARRSRFFFFHVRRVSGSFAPIDPEILDGGWRSWEEMRALCTQRYHDEMWRWHDGGRGASYWLTVRDPTGRLAARGGP